MFESLKSDDPKGKNNWFYCRSSSANGSIAEAILIKPCKTCYKISHSCFFFTEVNPIFPIIYWIVFVDCLHDAKIPAITSDEKPYWHYFSLKQQVSFSPGDVVSLVCVEDVDFFLEIFEVDTSL